MSRPTKDEYFLEIAKVVSSRSTCLRRHYGAVIVRDDVIIGTGYNGAARGIPGCIEWGTCERERLKVKPGERYELCVAVHAEQNAIIMSPPDRMIGATIYVMGFNADGSLAISHPCLMCERMIRNAQIKEVIYWDGNKIVKERVR